MPLFPSYGADRSGHDAGLPNPMAGGAAAFNVGSNFKLYSHQAAAASGGGLSRQIGELWGNHGTTMGSMMGSLSHHSAMLPLMTRPGDHMVNHLLRNSNTMGGRSLQVRKIPRSARLPSPQSGDISAPPVLSGCTFSPPNFRGVGPGNRLLFCFAAAIRSVPCQTPCARGARGPRAPLTVPPRRPDSPGTLMMDTCMTWALAMMPTAVFNRAFACGSKITTLRLCSPCRSVPTPLPPGTSAAPPRPPPCTLPTHRAPLRMRSAMLLKRPCSFADTHTVCRGTCRTLDITPLPPLVEAIWHHGGHLVW